MLENGDKLDPTDQVAPRNYFLHTAFESLKLQIGNREVVELIGTWAQWVQYCKSKADDFEWISNAFLDFECNTTPSYRKTFLERTVLFYEIGTGECDDYNTESFRQRRDLLGEGTDQSREIHLQGILPLDIRYCNRWLPTGTQMRVSTSRSISNEIRVDFFSCR